MKATRHRSRRRLLGTILGLAAGTLLAATGCRRGQSGAVPYVERVLLSVSNRGYFDVNIYIMQTAGMAGRRLGTVTGNSQANFWVAGSDLQPGNQLGLLLRAIGGRTTWMSPSVNVGEGIIARLDVFSTNSGDLYQSQLYTVFAQPATPDTSGAASR